MTAQAGASLRVLESVARGLVILILLGVAFRGTWLQLVGETGTGTGSTLILAPAVGALLTLLTLIWRRGSELPIHDRQADKIVGVVLLALAMMVQWLVLPRYASVYVLLHIDVTAAWLFGMAGCVFLFGLRRTGAFWPAWLVLVLPVPGAMRLAIYLLGGGDGAAIAVVAFVVLVGPSAVLLARITRGWPVRIRWTAPAVTPQQAWRSVPLLVAVTLVLALAPLPLVAQDRMSQGPPGQATPGMTIPSGWIQLESVDYPWASRMFGPSASLQRQLIRAENPRPDWDQLARTRQAIVQTLTVPRAGIFDTYPLEMIYDLRNARISPPTPVELPRGVSARYHTVVDDGLLLTWSLLTFLWARSPDEYQRVTLLTVDNHEFDAVFPEAVPGTVSTPGRLLSIQLRGSGSVTADNQQQKDLEMLTELSGDLVEAQWTTQ